MNKMLIAAMAAVFLDGCDSYAITDLRTSYKRSDCDWKETLIERPENA